MNFPMELTDKIFILCREFLLMFVHNTLLNLFLMVKWMKYQFNFIDSCNPAYPTIKVLI